MVLEQIENMAGGELLMAGAVIAGIIVTFVLGCIAIIRPKKVSLGDIPSRPNRLNPILLLIMFFAWLTIAQLCMQMFNGLEVEETFRQAAGSLVSQSLIAVIIFFVARAAFNKGLGRGGLGLESKKIGRDFVGGVVFGLSAVAVCMIAVYFVVALVKMIWPDYQPVDHKFITAVETASTGWKVVIFLSAVVGASVSEELLFRGIFQSTLRKYLPPWISILFVSLLFAAVHAEPQNKPSLFLLSVLLGWSYEKTGRITLPIFIHAIFNCIMLSAKLF